MKRKRRPITFSYVQKRAIEHAIEAAIDLYKRFLMNDDWDSDPNFEKLGRAHFQKLKYALATFQYKTKQIKKPKRRKRRKLT